MRRSSTVPSRAADGPTPFREAFIRLGIRFFLGSYVRVVVEGADQLPTGPYIICFNHPSWTDPFVLTAHWPDARRLRIFGPRERDMSVGWKNRVISWSGRGVPFQPAGADLIDATRRAVGVLRGGSILAIAGEGRLSDRDGEVLPLQEGVATFALLARVPIVPAGIIGTRWVRFGKRIRVRIGAPVDATGLPPGRAAARVLTARVQSELARLLDVPIDDRVPGPFARWLSDLFNDRPWLTQPAEGERPQPPGVTPGGGSPRSS
jgi:1-acyl-sn-glycerol-3-phosphate acyltransferase